MEKGKIFITEKLKKRMKAKGTGEKLRCLFLSGIPIRHIFHDY